MPHPHDAATAEEGRVLKVRSTGRFVSLCEGDLHALQGPAGVSWWGPEDLDSRSAREALGNCAGSSFPSACRGRRKTLEASKGGEGKGFVVQQKLEIMGSGAADC